MLIDVQAAESTAASEARRRIEAEARTAASADKLAEALAELAARRAECREVTTLRAQLAELKHEVEVVTAQKRAVQVRLVHDQVNAIWARHVCQ